MHFNALVIGKRPVVVFDVDGVVVENPPESQIKGIKPITNINYWDNHWTRPLDAKLNKEMTGLVVNLQQVGFHVVFLTARPAQYREATLMLLKRFCTEDPFYTSLEMIPDAHISVSSSEWKQTKIREWIAQGVEIRFYVEDYKPNADAVRSVVPVLLYERKKSDHLPFKCCGGISRCHCHAPVAK